MAHRPRLVASPASALADARPDVQVTGGRPGGSVTVRARVDDSRRGTWRSEAVFTPTSTGAVDLASAQPNAGRYRTADPFGLLWSLERDPTPVPLVGFAGPSEPFDVELTAEVDGVAADHARIRRGFVGPGLRREPVGDDGLVGAFFSPADGTARPGVLFLGGSDGGLAEGAAALLASHGFSVLALAYFRAEGLPADLVEIPLEYFETALRWLKDRPSVAPGRLGAVGRSRGGELALLLAATFPAITAVVGYVPSGVVHAGITASPAAGGAPRSAWTHRGKPVPFVPPPLDGRSPPPAAPAPAESPLELTPLFLRALEDRAAVDAAAIAVERIQGPVLLVSGEDDRLWPSPVRAERAVARLAAHGRRAIHLRYPGAGHMIGPVGLPATANTIVHPLRGRALALGGTPAGNAAAASDSWPRVVQFLRATLAGA
jgi:dienelactone hydrolase